MDEIEGEEGRGPSLVMGGRRTTRPLEEDMKEGRRRMSNSRAPSFCFSRQEGGFVSSESSESQQTAGQPATEHVRLISPRLFLGRKKEGYVD